jgi:glutaredoxin 3
MTAAVRMYTTRFCPYCVAARRLLSARGIVFDEIGVDGNPALRAQMQRESGRATVPQIWIGAQHVGGFDDLNALDRSGRLAPLLATATPAGSPTGNATPTF